MQRKRNKAHYSDHIELGSNIIPVSKGLMRRFKMKSLLKYAIMIIVGFIIYSVYQKVTMLSKESIHRAVDMIPDGAFVPKVEAPQELDKRENEAGDSDAINRRVKQEINKVFEEFRQQQAEKEQQNQDIFEENRVKDDVNAVNWDVQADEPRGQQEEFNKDIPEDVIGAKDDTFDGRRFDGQERDAGLEDGVIDKGDHFEKVMHDVMDIINEDEEKEELEMEEEIEHRLAEVLKDAVNEVADQKAEEDPFLLNQMNNVGENDIANGDGKVQEMGVAGGQDLMKQVFEKKEFNVAVDQMDQKLNPQEMHRLNEQLIRDEPRKDDDHEFPPFVTAAGIHTYREVTQLIASIQTTMPGRKIYVYDLDLTSEQKKHLMTYCGVRLRKFMKDLFPEYVKNFNNLHWKPLVIQTALAEFGHITWVNPQYRLSSQQLGPLFHDSHETGILVIGQFASYSTYAATNAKMYEFIPSNKEDLANTPHIEIRAMIVHNTPEVHQNVMKLFTACALEENCLAPPGSKWTCRFDFTGKKPAGCHRYDESAINILLKNWFQFDVNRFAKRNSFFKDYDPSYKPKLKLCRTIKDIRDTEL